MDNTAKQRTLPQNASLHLWLDMLAKSLNEAGYTLGDGVLIRVPVLYSKENLKENVVKPYMRALYPDISSTSELTTTQIQELYRNLDAIISERTGVHVEWPSIQGPVD